MNRTGNAYPPLRSGRIILTASAIVNHLSHKKKTPAALKAQVLWSKLSQSETSNLFLMSLSPVTGNHVRLKAVVAAGFTLWFRLG